MIEQDKATGYAEFLKDMHDNNKQLWRKFRRIIKQYQRYLSERILEQRQTKIDFQNEQGRKATSK